MDIERIFYKNLSYCDNIQYGTGREEVQNLQQWTPETDVLIVGFILESHIMPSRNAKHDSRGLVDGAKNLLMCNAYLTTELKELDTPGTYGAFQWIARTVVQLWWRNNQWIGNVLKTESITYPPASGIWLGKGRTINLFTASSNTTMESAGVGSCATLYYTILYPQGKVKFREKGGNK